MAVSTKKQKKKEKTKSASEQEGVQRFKLNIGYCRLKQLDFSLSFCPFCPFITLFLSGSGSVLSQCLSPFVERLPPQAIHSLDLLSVTTKTYELPSATQDKCGVCVCL